MKNVERTALPVGLVLVRTTPEFTEHTVPPALLNAHATAAEVWGNLVLRSGSATFVFDDEPDRPIELMAGDSVAIAPGRLHHVVITGDVQFVVEFYRAG